VETAEYEEPESWEEYEQDDVRVAAVEQRATGPGKGSPPVNPPQGGASQVREGGGDVKGKGKGKGAKGFGGRGAP
jgi:hypothetical protein